MNFLQTQPLIFANQQLPGAPALDPKPQAHIPYALDTPHCHTKCTYVLIPTEYKQSLHPKSVYFYVKFRRFLQLHVKHNLPKAT